MGEKIFYKKNGVVKKVSSKPNLAANVDGEKVQHLCWQYCVNANPINCPKIRDFEKKNLEDYDFITDGYQIVDKNGDIDTFFVHKCSNYKKSLPKPFTKEERIKKRAAKKGLMIGYFDTLTIEEAYELQRQLIERGDILKPKGALKNEYCVRKDKQRVR